MANGVLISSFVLAGVPSVNAVFGFFKTSSGVQIQRLQITGQTGPVGGNVTIQLVDESGTAYSGATVALPNGSSYYDQPLAAPVTLGLNKIVRAKVTGVDTGVASDLVVNLIGATAQGSNAPTGCGGSNECQQPAAQLLFFNGSVAQEQAAAAASAAEAAASAATAVDARNLAALAESGSVAAKNAAETAEDGAEAQVALAVGWANNANNAAAAAGVYAGQAQTAKTAAEAAQAAAEAAAAAGIRGARAQLNAAAVKSIADATPTAIGWDGIQFDDAGFWSAANPTRITIPAGVTRVRLTAGVRWAASATGERKLSIRSNPSGIYEANSIWASDDRPSDATGDATVPTGPIDVEEGMYFEAIVEQNSGGALALETTAADNHGNFLAIEILKTS